MNRKIERPDIRVRFAPSPTGYLHIGGLRTALFNWLFARHFGGVFLIRVEDTDLERSTTEFMESQLASLAWAGIHADEPIVIQSQHLAKHKQVLDQLLQSGKAYKCYCTKDELVKRFTTVHQDEDDFFVKYDGYCRGKKEQPDKPYVIRFKIPYEEKTVSWDDLIRGTVTFELDQLDDFIIARSDGRPMYNFVVVVDDNAMKISHVIRGEDHISNTPKQILLYRACGYTLPYFAHLPIILGTRGHKLSKRDAATSVLEYKSNGYLPDALINYLARLGWSHGDQEIFSPDELIRYFSLEHVGKKGAVFDPEKLLWVNSVYIRESKPKELIVYIEQNLDADFVTKLDQWDTQKIYKAISLYQDRVSTVRELMDEVESLYEGPKDFNPEDIKKWIRSETNKNIDSVIQELKSIQDFSAEILSPSLKTLAKKLNVKLVELLQPIRIALIGKSAGPGVFELLSCIGKKESISRIQTFLQLIPDLRQKET